MDGFVLIVAGSAVYGIVSWLIERRRSPDYAVRTGIKSAIILLCIIGLGELGRALTPSWWPDAGFVGGLILGAVLAAVVTRTAGLEARRR